MPKITVEPRNRGLFQSTGSGLHLLKGDTAVTTSNDTPNTIVLSATDGPVINVTSGAGANIVHLPNISADTVGLTLMINVGANGFELRSFAEDTQLLNGATGGPNVEAAISANSSIICVCTSATNWAVVGLHGTSVAA